MCPQLLLPAGNDPPNLKEGGEIVAIVQDKAGACKTREFPHMSHGWVIRGDATQEDVARDVKEAVGEVTQWFTQHLDLQDDGAAAAAGAGGEGKM